jgi:hypothetical protein
MTMKLLAALAFCTAAAGATAAAAQAPVCDGRYEVIRTDTVKPGQMELFKKAVADHQAWYVAHKLPDHILIGRVLQPRGAPGGPFSDTTVMTFHTDAATPGSPPHDGDKAWDHYVAEYNASSDVVSTTVVCIASPK